MQSVQWPLSAAGTMACATSHQSPSGCCWAPSSGRLATRRAQLLSIHVLVASLHLSMRHRTIIESNRPDALRCCWHFGSGSVPEYAAPAAVQCRTAAASTQSASTRVQQPRKSHLLHPHVVCRDVVQDVLNILGSLYVAILFIGIINSMTCGAAPGPTACIS